MPTTIRNIGATIGTRRRMTVIDTAQVSFGPGVYRITNRITGECYVGACSEMSSRLRNHAHLLARGSHHSKLLQASYKKHGAAAFDVEVLERCGLRKLSYRETAWFDLLEPAFCMRRPEFRVRRGVTLRKLNEARKLKRLRELEAA